MVASGHLLIMKRSKPPAMRLLRTAGDDVEVVLSLSLVLRLLVAGATSVVDICFAILLRELITSTTDGMEQE